MTEQQIFDYLRSKGMTEAGAAGLMGNLIAESGLRSNNLQNTFEKSLGLDDETYTAAVDSGMYQNFVHDSAGYGLAQWTYWSRKQNLLNFAKQQGKSIGDMQMQLDFLAQEIKGYGSVWTALTTASSIRAASDAVLLQYERPANQSEQVRQSRAALGQGVYDRCKNVSQVVQVPDLISEIQNEVLTISRLATSHVEFGTINSNPRKNKVSKITIHHMAGVMTGVGCARMHLQNPGRQASANYYIGNEGDICSGVREDRRAWTSGTGNEINTNDHMAITIEVSNSATGGNWPISDKAYKALIALCADICKRYNINPHYDGTKNGTLTLHKMFQNTVCPGPYLENLHKSGKIEADIKNAMDGFSPDVTIPMPDASVKTPFLVRILISDLYIRTGPSMLHPTRGYIPKGTYTITNYQNGWGKLKSGVGWIYVDNPSYVTKL